MDLVGIIESVKKYGTTAVLTLCLLLMYNFFTTRMDRLEAKLEKVEAHLYDCLDDKAQLMNRGISNLKFNPEKMFAVIPKKYKFKIISA
jgi:translation elongation factor EF-G